MVKRDLSVIFKCDVMHVFSSQMLQIDATPTLYRVRTHFESEIRRVLVWMHPLHGMLKTALEFSS